MKLFLDAEGDYLEIVFGKEAHGLPERVGQNVFVWCADEGEVAHILVRGLSTLTIGARLQNLQLDLAPRPATSIEFTPQQTEKLSRKLAEMGVTWPAPKE